MASHSPPAAPAGYTRTAVALHWLIALLIVCGFALGWVMTDIPGFTPAKLRYFSWQKWIGKPIVPQRVARLVRREPPRLLLRLHHIRVNIRTATQPASFH